jgi:hypothetical protein
VKIIDEREDCRWVSIDTRCYLDARVTWQRQTDDYQKDDDTGNTVKKFLHVAAASLGGVELFHSTAAG